MRCWYGRVIPGRMVAVALTQPVRRVEVVILQHSTKKISWQGFRGRHTNPPPVSRDGFGGGFLPRCSADNPPRIISHICFSPGCGARHYLHFGEICGGLFGRFVVVRRLLVLCSTNGPGTAQARIIFSQQVVFRERNGRWRKTSTLPCPLPSALWPSHCLKSICQRAIATGGRLGVAECFER
jgi:hypothetical protein